MVGKSLLRKTALQYRQLLRGEEFETRNDLLKQKLLDLIRARDAQTIHFYLPMPQNREPDMTGLFPFLWAEGRRIAVSKTHFKDKSLSHYLLEETTGLKNNAWGIPEPVDARPVDAGEIDLIVVPLLLADRQHHRLGYGGGFYDRFLADTAAYKIGLSLGPLLDQLPVDDWDVPLDQVLTSLG